MPKISSPPPRCADCTELSCGIFACPLQIWANAEPERRRRQAAAESDRRRRGKRLAEKFRRYEPELKSAILRMVVPQMEETIAAQLPNAVVASLEGLNQ